MEVQALLPPVPPSTAWTTPVGCVPVGYYRNGLLQSPYSTPPDRQPDYTHILSPGTLDRWLVTWLPASIPQTGDVVSVKCAYNSLTP